MKRLTTLLVLGSLLVALSGCAGYRHNKAGDAAASTGDMRSAVYHYERAMAHKSKYARDPDFLSKLTTAQSRVAYDDAVHLRTQGRYESAIDKLHESMRKDPGFAKPAELLPQIKIEAARWRYAKAVQAADADDLGAARGHLEQSLRHDLSNEQAAFAMASLTPNTLPPSTPGLNSYHAGLSKSAEKRWLDAERLLQQSVGENAGLLPARAALNTAQSKLSEAHALTKEGASAFKSRRIGPAMDLLNQSLEVWPYHDRASELLVQAKAQRALADARFAAANKLGGEAKWDDAIAQADSGLSIDLSHQALGKLRGELPKRAAADYTNRGDGHLAKTELDKAHLAYNRALGYRKTHDGAQRGLANVYTSWAAAHEQAGRSGAALLNFRKAKSYATTKAAEEGTVRMGAAVRERLGMGLALQVDSERGGDVDPQRLGERVSGELTGHRSRGLALHGEGLPYELRLSITQADIDLTLTGASNRTHHYTTREQRHNREYDRVAACLRDAERDYDRACRAYNRAAGHGHGSHHHEHDAHHNHHYHSVQSARSRVDRYRRQLSCTPRYITVTLHHEWDYVVETYTKAGRLEVTSELVETASGKVVNTFNHQATFSQTDDRVLNANPSIGVQADSLRLQTDSTVRGIMVGELAGAAAPWGVQAAIDHRLSQVNAKLDALQAKGQTDAALEERVNAAVLLGIADRGASEKSLQGLIERYTR